MRYSVAQRWARSLAPVGAVLGMLLWYRPVPTVAPSPGRKPNPQTHRPAELYRQTEAPALLIDLASPAPEPACSYGLEMQQLKQAMTYSEPSCRNLAVQLAGKSPGTYNLGQVCEIYDHCLAQWRYVNDPRSLEYLSAAHHSLQASYSGDCDDFAILVGTLIGAIGGDVRIQKAYQGNQGHSYCEVNLGATDKNQVLAYLKKRYPHTEKEGGKSFYFRDDETGLWMNLDWDAGYPGGSYFAAERSIAFHTQDGYCREYN
jgi:hypothetical protein